MRQRQGQGQGQVIPVWTGNLRATSQDWMVTELRADNKHMMHEISTKRRDVAKSPGNDQHVRSVSTSHGTAAGNEC